MSLSDRIEPLYTAEEIRKILKFKSIYGIYRLLKREGVGYKVGRQIYVKEKDLQQLIEKNPL